MSDQYRPPQPPAPAKSSRIKPGIVVAIVATLLLGCCIATSFLWLLVDGFTRTPGAGFTPPPADSVVETEEWGTVPAGYIWVVLSGGEGRAAADEIAEAGGGAVIGEIGDIGLYQIRTTATDEQGLRAALDAARADKRVDSAFPDQLVTPDVTGTRCTPLSDTVYGGRTFDVIGVQRAWDVVKSSGVSLAPVRVGVLDTGVYRATGEFEGAVKVETSGADDSLKAKAAAYGSHGTAVTGVIAADAENAGVAGVASVLGDKMSVSVTNIWGSEYSTWKPAAPGADDAYMDDAGQSWAVGDLVAMKKQISGGATIINCSWGNRSADPFLVNAYKRFFAEMAKNKPEVLFVCSAGNEGKAPSGSTSLPGGLTSPNMITVGSVDANGNRSSFSNTAGSGFTVDIAAPGNDIPIGTGDDGAVITADGTSFSTPQVTATAAMLRAIDPSMDAAALKELILATASPGVTDAAGLQSIPAPKELGGRVLSTEFAVLAAANKVRAAKNLPALDGSSLAAVRIDLTAEPTAQGAWAVTASVPDAGAKGTSAELTYNGSGSISGRTVQQPGKGGTAKWTVTVSGDSMTVHVKRADTGACWRVVLPGGEALAPEPAADPGFVGWFSYTEPPSSGDRGMDLRIHIDEQGAVTGEASDGQGHDHYYDVSGTLSGGEFRGVAASRDLKEAYDWELVGSVKGGVLTIYPVGWSAWQMPMKRE